MPALVPPPLWLLAELTYKCPLQCPYCSNPLDFAGARFRQELTTAEWCRVFREAKALGVLQLGLSGGEPTLRPDLETLVATAHELGLYTSLITSAYRLTRARLAALRRAGLDHVQISVQAAEADLSDEIAGTASYRDKIAAYHATRELGFPLTVNAVLHRRNLHQVAALIGLAESLGAERIELANTQFYGWALHNRDALMPTKAQLEQAWQVVQRERARLGTKLEIVWVLPDYYERYPKPCMGGWGRAYMTVTPAGEVWPCHAAGRITTLRFASVRDRSLDWIWNESDAFTRFRGDAWMPEPCRSCPRKAVDFGGCRCQAFLVAGDAALTDPVCSLAPHRPLIDAAIAAAEGAAAAEQPAAPWTYRAAPASRSLAARG
jgi:PqqA peptide cyclase